MLLSLKKTFKRKIVKSLDLIAVLWYTKYANKLNTGTGVSTEVSLPSGSSVERRVGSNPVACTKKRKAPLRCFFLFSDGNAEPTCEQSEQSGDFTNGKVGLKCIAFPVQYPVTCTKKERTFVSRQMFSFCLSKPQAWHIIDTRSVAYIIKGSEPPLYLITL